MGGVAGVSVSDAFDILDTKANKLVVKIKEGHSSNDVLKHFIQQGINIEAFNEILPHSMIFLSGSLREPMQNRGHSCKLKINRKCMQAILLTTINTDTIFI